MRRFGLFFVTFLFVFTFVEISADENNENYSQEKEGKFNDVHEKKSSSSQDINQGNGGGNNTNEILYNNNFLEENEDKKISEEEIAANQAILKESVKKNQSGFWGWLGRFFGNICDEINADRIVDFLWHKAEMEHEKNEEYNALKGRIKKYSNIRAFERLLIKYLEGKEINVKMIQEFKWRYNKIKKLAAIFGEGNDIEDDSLRLITLERILGDRDNDTYGVLSALDSVPGDKLEQLQNLLDILKANEEEFINCFSEMSAVEKYNLEKAAFYDKKKDEAYCNSQWLTVDKEGFHVTSRSISTYVKIAWKVIRLLIGICAYGFFTVCFMIGEKLASNTWGSSTYLDDAGDLFGFALVIHFIFCLPMLVAQFKGLKNFFTISQSIIEVILFIIILGQKSTTMQAFSFIINKITIICVIIAIALSFIEGFCGLKYVFNKEINKNLAFLLNKKFKYIKNYIETLKKIHALIKGDEAFTLVFKKELASLEKVFGNEAGEEMKDMLTKIDNQKLYDSFDDVNDTGEAMLLFDNNKDIFNNCIVDVNKINACVTLKMNVSPEQYEIQDDNEKGNVEVKETFNESVVPEQSEIKADNIDKIETIIQEDENVKAAAPTAGENNEKENCKEEDLSSKDVKEVNPGEKQPCDVEGDKKKKDEPKEKNVVKKDIAKQDESKEQLDNKVQSEIKNNAKRSNNKKRRRKRFAKKRQVRTSDNNNRIRRNKKGKKLRKE